MTTSQAEATMDRPGDPCTIVIFGASGDLTKRKLLPALYNLRSHALLPRDFAVVGVGRQPLEQNAFRAQMSEQMKQFAPRTFDPKIWADFEPRLYYASGEFGDPATYERISGLLTEANQRHHTGGNVLFYLATPPTFFAEVARQLATSGLSREEDGRWRRVIIEKPFGRDLDSALALNQQLREVLKETQLYRIDHYLGKETVQNIMVFRFANGLLEPVWNRRYVDHVQLTVAESIGVEGRGGYYDQSGVLRDMIQNHMFQLLALVAMEPPSSLDAEAVRNEKVKVLDAIRPVAEEEVLQSAVRGQYGDGFQGNAKVPAYRTERRVSQTSKTETYAALKMGVENWRWAGVPFYLRSGKRLPTRRTEIVIQFRRPPLMLFRHAGVSEIEPNRLIIEVQPNEGIRIEMKAKVPGPAIKLANVGLKFDYKDFGEAAEATGYERLLYDCMIGDSTLFHRADMVEAAWRIATPVLDVWASLPARDFPNYSAGTWGPSAADQLLARNGHRWMTDGVSG